MIRLPLFALLSLLIAHPAIGQAAAPAPSSNPQVVLETSKGTFEVELFADKAPETVKNFLNYVNQGFYDGTVFHRVISDFMIQGGGLTPDLNKKKTEAPIQNEADNGLLNDRGTLAMARTGNPHSATAQFFVNLKNNDFLNHRAKSGQGWGYAVFGKVTSGMEVVDAIAAVPTGVQKRMRDVPNETVMINKATVKK